MKLKISELISKIDEKNRHYLLIGALLFIFLLDYFILMRPQLVTLTKINPEIKLLSQDIEKAREDIGKLGFYQAEVKRLEGQLAQTSQKVKSREEVSIVLEQISRLANQNNIRIEQIMPFIEEQKVLLEDKKRTYYALPILVQAKAGYHDFGRFINQLEKGDLFLYVTSFSIATGEDAHAHALKINLQAIVFEEGNP